MNLKKSNKWIFLGLFVLNITLLRAQDAHFLNVDDLFKQGIENSLKLKSDKINETIATQEINVAKTGMLPDISVDLTDGYLGKVTVFTDGLTKPVYPYMPNWSQNYIVGLSQPIYTGGKIKRNIEKAALQKELAQLTSNKDKSELKLVLMSKYLELFRLYKQKDVMNRNIEDAKQRLHDIQEMKKQGMITGNDLIRSELLLNNLNLMLREVEDNILINSQQLDVALGLNEDWILIPDQQLLEQKLPMASIETYIEQAYQQLPELKVANSEIKQAKKKEEITRADYLPSLFLQAGSSLERPIINISPVEDMFLNGWSVSLKLSYKLSSLYKNPNKISISKQSVDFQKVQKEQQEQNIRTNIKSVFIKHQEALDKVDVLTLSVKQANENYRIVYNKYKNSMAILTDLLDASGVKLDAEMQLTTAKANVVYTYYQLLRMSGNL